MFVSMSPLNSADSSGVRAARKKNGLVHGLWRYHGKSDKSGELRIQPRTRARVNRFAVVIRNNPVPSRRGRFLDVSVLVGLRQKHMRGRIFSIRLGGGQKALTSHGRVQKRVAYGRRERIGRSRDSMPLKRGMDGFR